MGHGRREGCHSSCPLRRVRGRHSTSGAVAVVGGVLQRDQVHPAAAELGHVVGIGRQHGHRSRLAQGRLGDGGVDGVLVAIQPCGLEQLGGRLRGLFGDRFHLDA